MYTDEMRRVVRSINAPKGFGVDIIDNDTFLTLRIDERSLFRLTHDDKITALQYVIRLKDALEQNGAIVLVTREALK